MNEVIKLIPFSSWINAKVLMRAWDYNTSNKTDCNVIDWIDFDQILGTAIINRSKITSVDTIIVGFQAQSYTFLDSNSLVNIVTDLQAVTFILFNNNCELK